MNSLLLVVNSNWLWILNANGLVRIALHGKEFLVLLIKLLLLLEIPPVLFLKPFLMFHVLLMLFVIFSLLFLLNFLVLKLHIFVLFSLDLMMLSINLGVKLMDLSLRLLPLIFKFRPNFSFELIHLLFYLHFNFLINKVCNSLPHVRRDLSEFLSVLCDEIIWGIMIQWLLHLSCCLHISFIFYIRGGN